MKDIQTQLETLLKDKRGQIVTLLTVGSVLLLMSILKIKNPFTKILKR